MVDINNVVADYKAARKRFNDEVKAAVHTLFKEFFDKYPQFENISWTQYANYFNDGDECNFYVREREYEAESLTGYGFRAPGRWDTASFQKEYAELPLETRDEYERLEQAFLTLDGTLDRIPSEMFEDMFGNDAKVIVTKDGITVESYTNHD